MNVQVILHASFEPAGVIKDWALEHGHELMTVCPYRGEKLHELDQFDALIIMGGPQSALDADQYAYLLDEMNLIREAVLAEKRVLGVCLGAQLIGQSLGGNAERSPHKEIGIWPVQLTEAGRQDPLLAHFPAVFDVAHWHGDMPGIPQGAEVLASSVGCPRQIVRFREHVYGFQCHPEMTVDVMKRLADHCEEELVDGKFIQLPQQFLNYDYSQMNEYIFSFLNRFFKK